MGWQGEEGLRRRQQTCGFSLLDWSQHTSGMGSSYEVHFYHQMWAPSVIHSLAHAYINKLRLHSVWLTTPSGIGPPALAPQQVVTLSDFLVGRGILINHTVFVSLRVIKGGTGRVDDEVLRLQMEVIADKCRSKKRKCSEAWEKVFTQKNIFCNRFCEIL